MERKNGYVIIENWKKINRNFIGHNAKGWFMNGTDEYLFKSYLNELERYRELYYTLIIKKLGLKSPEIDLAKFKDQLGTIAKNYNPQHRESYTIVEVLSYASKYNLRDLPNEISNFCIEKKWNYSIKKVPIEIKDCLIEDTQRCLESVENIVNKR